MGKTPKYHYLNQRFCAIDSVKEKKKHPDIDFVYDYLSRNEASNIDKVS